MKHISRIIPTLFAIYLLGGCISSRQARSNAVLAPLKPDMSPEQVIVWPAIPVVRLQDGQQDTLHEQFGDAEPAVRSFLRSCMTDHDACQNALRQNTQPAKPDFFRHLSGLMKAILIPTLSLQNKKNLDELMLMHNLCCQMNDVFFLLAKPYESTEALQKALKAATALKNLLDASPIMNIPPIMRRAAIDGDVLGTEWTALFDGVTPLSPVPDEWMLAAEETEKTTSCCYGHLYPSVPAATVQPEDKPITLSVQTKIPHDGKTPVYLVGQGLPEGFAIKLDGVPLALDAGTVSARITIPPQIITGKPQTLAISWKSNLHDNKRIFRQFWFVMKN
ncbi:MAG: hypothetical protein J5743_01730 [Victivallales bacterium]|nr:hypothetical protein [Victivallales bacterium]